MRKQGLALVMAALLAGCGSSAVASPTPSPQGSVPPTPAATTPAPTAAPTVTTPDSQACVFSDTIATLVVQLVFPDLSGAECSALDLTNATRIAGVPTGTPDCTATLGGHAVEVFGDDAAGDVCSVFTATPTDTPSAGGGGNTVAIGSPVDITCDGADCLEVVVDKVAFAKYYRDPAGFLNDTPAKGDVYLAYHVTYTATGPNADYNPYDWQVYVNDTAADNITFVEHGPTPELGSGQLPQGKKASGWVIQEVPATGRIVIAYQPGANGDIFEVVARSK